MLGEFTLGVTATAGTLWLVWEVVDTADRIITRRKERRKRRAAQKKRLAEYETGDRRPAPLMIAQEYAAEHKDVARALYAGAVRIDEMRKCK